MLTDRESMLVLVSLIVGVLLGVWAVHLAQLRLRRHVPRRFVMRR
jgi:hypothetical protein